MIDEHTQGRETSSRRSRTRKHLTWPAALPADAIALKDRLSKLSGAAFDRAYIDAMVDGHREVLADVRSRGSVGRRPGGEGVGRPKRAPRCRRT